ncbi:hypothetical protein Poli38472_003599 [Pythium oligandrum]|uniref:FAD/NAD(P)-binding domain-containing protein n=1 Tax=Pythium oligandrum TaxID=41045 RepID=A0A8K1FM20_PYTOL|nr:hypothetical protein Poli38472_003599 [Pythium oligandrum]|eukprot:TMW65834.1 hypothetical protein Poli38472_003599 [Pythium oligandrum]
MVYRVYVEKISWIRSNMRVVVVGSGIAGTSCVEELYRLQALGYATERPLRVTLVSPSQEITKATVTETVTETLQELHVETRVAADWRASFPALEIVHGIVKRVDREKQVIGFDDDRVIEYDRLCICSGARPEILHQPVGDFESVESLKTKLVGSRRVVVVGNGRIAMELVEALDVFDVVWSIKHNHIGNTFLDRDAADFILPKSSRLRRRDELHQSTTPDKEDIVVTSQLTHERRRIATCSKSAVGPDWMHSFKVPVSPILPAEAGALQIEYNTQVDAILDASSGGIIWGQAKPSNSKDMAVDEWPLRVILTNGNMYGCDLVVCATGVVPNTDLLQECWELADSEGIPVSDSMQSLQDTRVSAAGDCAHVESDAECWFQMRLWSQARATGRRAAQSILNADLEAGLELELFAHATHFFGHRVVLFGLYNGEEVLKTRLPANNVLVLVRETPGVEYVKVILVDGRVKGAMLIGDTGLEDAFENLILNQLDVSSVAAHLLDPDVGIEDFFD